MAADGSNKEDDFDRIRLELDGLLEKLDLSGFAKDVESFGREKPMAMLFAAFTVGMASGLLMRRTTEAR